MSSQGVGCFVSRFTLAAVVAAGLLGEARAQCSESTARLVARAYVVASPVAFDEGAFRSFLAQNREAFARNGAATRCMKKAGQRLMGVAVAGAAGPRGPSATETFGGSMPEGLSHIPGQVDASMASGASDALTMAQELVWLADVLPAAAAGDFGPFAAQNTFGRQTWLQIAPVLQAMCVTSPEVCQVTAATLQQMLPIVEQQVYALAVQAGR